MEYSKMLKVQRASLRELKKRMIKQQLGLTK